MSVAGRADGSRRLPATVAGTFQLGFFSSLQFRQHRGLCLFQHAVQPTQHGTRQDDFAVLGLLVIAAQQIRDGSDEGRKVRVAPKAFNVPRVPKNGEALKRLTKPPTSCYGPARGASVERQANTDAPQPKVKPGRWPRAGHPMTVSLLPPRGASNGPSGDTKRR